MRLLLDVIQIVLLFYLAASPTNALKGMTTNTALKLERWVETSRFSHQVASR